MTFLDLKDAALRFFLPEICVHCREDIPAGARGPLCRACQGRLAFDGLSVRGASCAVLYRGPAVSLIHAFKFRGLRAAAVLAGGLMGRALPGLAELAGFDALVPVPLHPQRELERGYNQALILALEVSRRSGLPVVDLLERVRPTRASWGLSRGERLKNVSRAFRARRGFSGGSFLVVDDVLTTGATFDACAWTLREAGARRVSGYAFARAPLI